MSVIDSIYGLKPYSIDEECKLPENIKQTRRHKMEMINQLEHMKSLADSLIATARAIPELDDDAHAELVGMLADGVGMSYYTLHKYAVLKGEAK